MDAAAETGVSTRGGNLRFPVHLSGRVLTDKDIVTYCSCWCEPLHPADMIEVGWRPRVEPEDKTVIQLLSKDLLQCQGRIDTVSAISVIAAGLVCRVPPLVAMACPSSAPFWDWAEKHRLRVPIDRPISSLYIPPDDGKKKNLATLYNDNTAISSQTVKEYRKVVYSDAWRSLLDDRSDELEEIDMPYVSPALAEANALMDESMEIVMKSYSGQFHLRTEMRHPYTINTGELLAFCKKIWHDSELYHMGTRWRPAYMPNARSTSAAKTGEKRGGVFLPDQYKTGITIMGSPTICVGLSPILAALRIRLHPEIAKKTNVFQSFYEFMNWDPRRDTPEPSVVDDTPPASWHQRVDEDEFQSGRFAHEERVMQRVMRVLRGDFNRSQGQCQAGYTLPGVQWSRSDFVNHLMTWWPEAEIQDRAHFRYVPGWMDKGGLEMHEGGDYFSQQGKAQWQNAQMPMIASLVCGIPAEIAALLRASDQFWSFVATQHSPPAVHAHRERLRHMREARFGAPGGEWDQRRAAMGDVGDAVSSSRPDASHKPRAVGSSQSSSGWGQTYGGQTNDWSGNSHGNSYDSGYSKGHDSYGKSDGWTGQSGYGKSGGASYGSDSRYGNYSSKGAYANDDRYSSYGETKRSSEPAEYRSDYYSKNDKPAYQSESRSGGWGSSGEKSYRDDSRSGWSAQAEKQTTYQSESRPGWSPAPTTAPVVVSSDNRWSATPSPAPTPASTQPNKWDMGPATKVVSKAPMSMSDVIAAMDRQFKLSRMAWTEAQLSCPMKAWEVAEWLCEMGKATVGSACPKWSVKNRGDHLTCVCEGLFGGTQIHFLRSETDRLKSDLFNLVGVSCTEESAFCATEAVQLVAALACHVPAVKVPEKDPECGALIDLMVRTLLPADDQADVVQYFTPSALAEITPSPVEICPPISAALAAPVRSTGWPTGQVVRMEWEIADAYFCVPTGRTGEWVRKSELVFT